MVRRWGRCCSRVRHRVVPDHERVPDRCHASGAAVDICSDTPAGAQRAERAVAGSVVDVSRALSGSPRAPRITAQRGARFDPLEYPQLLATKKITSRDTVGLAYDCYWSDGRVASATSAWRRFCAPHTWVMFSQVRAMRHRPARRLCAACHVRARHCSAAGILTAGKELCYSATSSTSDTLRA